MSSDRFTFKSTVQWPPVKIAEQLKAHLHTKGGTAAVAATQSPSATRTSSDLASNSLQLSMTMRAATVAWPGTNPCDGVTILEDSPKKLTHKQRYGIISPRDLSGDFITGNRNFQLDEGCCYDTAVLTCLLGNSSISLANADITWNSKRHDITVVGHTSRKQKTEACFKVSDKAFVMKRFTLSTEVKLAGSLLKTFGGSMVMPLVLPIELKSKLVANNAAAVVRCRATVDTKSQTRAYYATARDKFYGMGCDVELDVRGKISTTDPSTAVSFSGFHVDDASASQEVSEFRFSRVAPEFQYLDAFQTKSVAFTFSNCAQYVRVKNIPGIVLVDPGVTLTMVWEVPQVFVNLFGCNTVVVSGKVDGEGSKLASAPLTGACVPNMGDNLVAKEFRAVVDTSEDKKCCGGTCNVQLGVPEPLPFNAFFRACDDDGTKIAFDCTLAIPSWASPFGFNFATLANVKASFATHVGKAAAATNTSPTVALRGDLLLSSCETAFEIAASLNTSANAAQCVDTICGTQKGDGVVTLAALINGLRGHALPCPHDMDCTRILHNVRIRKASIELDVATKRVSVRSNAALFMGFVPCDLTLVVENEMSVSVTCKLAERLVMGDDVLFAAPTAADNVAPIAGPLVELAWAKNSVPDQLRGAKVSGKFFHVVVTTVEDPPATEDGDPVKRDVTTFVPMLNVSGFATDHRIALGGTVQVPKLLAGGTLPLSLSADTFQVPFVHTNMHVRGAFNPGQLEHLRQAMFMAVRENRLLQRAVMERMDKELSSAKKLVELAQSAATTAHEAHAKAAESVAEHVNLVQKLRTRIADSTHELSLILARLNAERGNSLAFEKYAGRAHRIEADTQKQKVALDVELTVLNSMQAEKCEPAEAVLQTANTKLANMQLHLQDVTRRHQREKARWTAEDGWLDMIKNKQLCTIASAAVVGSIRAPSGPTRTTVRSKWHCFPSTSEAALEVVCRVGFGDDATLKCIRVDAPSVTADGIDEAGRAFGIAVVKELKFFASNSKQ